MGMVSEDDMIVALSNSGETTELSDILCFAKRRGIFIVAITQNSASTLATLADLTLLIPQVPEAFSSVTAPTTSSTMMLALGDALAVSLLKQSGFSKHDFKSLHPGGQLGNRLKRVQDVMHMDPDIPLVSDTALMNEAILIMAKKRFGCVGVISRDNALVGIITDGDLRRHMSNQLLEEKACNVMTGNPKTIAGTALVEEAVHSMAGAVGSLFVVDEENHPVGIVNIHDMLRLNLF
jgi:arabinose-5-phosphate isomerase